MILLLGSGGSLATAARREFATEGLHIVERNDYSQWFAEDASHLVKEYVEGLPEEPKIIINAVGVVDPSAPKSELLDVNFHLPANLIDAVENSPIKVVTFGSIMENFPEISQSNNYLRSKYLLNQFIDLDSNRLSRVLHLQLHTWYGGVRLHKHMFLGQMFDAIQERKTFKMSSGRQVREYHHIDDDVRAIRYLLDQGTQGIFRLNHGQSHSLRNIAEYVFSAFDMSDLLQVGSLEDPIHENFLGDFPRASILADFPFRDSLPAIVDYFKHLRGA